MSTFNYIDCYDCYSKVISNKGYHPKRSASTTVSDSIAAVMPGGSALLANRVREYTSNISFDYIGKGRYSVESWQYTKNSNAWELGRWAENYQGTFTDIITDTQRKIVFADLRNDIVVVEETEIKIVLNGGTIAEPIWAPKGVNMPPAQDYFWYVKFPNATVELTRTTRNVWCEAGTERVIADTESTQRAGYKVALNFSPGFQLTNSASELYTRYKEWEPYFVGGYPNPAPDGYDYFEPFWQTVENIFDTARNYRFYDARGGNATRTYDTGLDVRAWHLQPAPVGSWAFDSAGNRLFSQHTVAGTTVTELKNKTGEVVPLSEVEPPLITPYLVPIAPV